MILVAGAIMSMKFSIRVDTAQNEKFSSTELNVLIGNNKKKAKKQPRDAAPPDCLIPIKRDCETTSPHKISQLEGNKTQLSL